MNLRIRIVGVLVTLGSVAVLYAGGRMQCPTDEGLKKCQAAIVGNSCMTDSGDVGVCTQHYDALTNPTYCGCDLAE